MTPGGGFPTPVPKETGYIAGQGAEFMPVLTARTAVTDCHRQSH
jgi:hypothetical protein